MKDKITTTRRSDVNDKQETNKYKEDDETRTRTRTRPRDEARTCITQQASRSCGHSTTATSRTSSPYLHLSSFSSSFSSSSSTHK
ncbi:hypothetical protein E2C01_060484 [Portunus trituberculatus]|uniref:Uncharacterized protein n=1 Tax=Portunus trituberculatus TaxID=210409 RepID=A0A5B7H8U7_PORTR|nr:hypothetical protein [Portunus trituberculatus]